MSTIHIAVWRLVFLGSCCSSSSLHLFPFPGHLPGRVLRCIWVLIFLLHREFVRLVILDCHLIVDSLELMEIPLLYIKFPIPCNRPFTITIFEKPAVPMDRFCAQQSVKKGGGTAWAKIRTIWPGDLCFREIINHLIMSWLMNRWYSYSKRTERNAGTRLWSLSVRIHLNMVWDDALTIPGVSRIECLTST